MKKAVLLIAIFCICNSYILYAGGSQELYIKPVQSDIPGLIKVFPAQENYIPVPMPVCKPVQENLTKKFTKTGTPGQPNVLNSIDVDEILFLNQRMVFKINTQTRAIEYISPGYSLSPLCEQALNIVPRWMRKDLKIKFRELNDKSKDDEFAQLILDAAAISPLIVDETAFQVAYSSTNSLCDIQFDRIDLLIRNARLIYISKDSLKYVRLKEYGSYESGDYYTTTEYKVKKGVNDVAEWVEIPKEYYYWYIVHPKIYLEGVYDKDMASSIQQRTYGYFWRDYIWNNPDPDYDYTKVNITTSKGTVSTIPRFGELIQKPELLWDRRLTYYQFNRPFAVGDDALNTIGNWASRAIPVDAVGNRPLQPNQVLYEHNGNCGEDATLVAAACRTALIPIIHLNTSCEDHAFGAIWESDWQHFEFFRGGLAEISNEFYGVTSLLWGGSYGWVTSMVEGTRPDGNTINHTKYYAKELSTIDLTILDEWGAPVDGANVIIYAAPSAHGTGAVAAGNAWTNSEGNVKVTVGAGKAYYFKFSHHKLGTLPEGNQIFVLTQGVAVNGQTYKGTARYTNSEMPKINSDVVLTPDTAAYGVKLNFTMTEIINAVSAEDSQQGRFNFRCDSSKPAVGFFVCNKENYNKYLVGGKFESYGRIDRCFESSLEFGLPGGSNEWYVVLTNETSVTNYKEITAKCELTEQFEDTPHITPPILSSPADSSTELDKNLTLKWNPVTGAKSYKIELSTIKNFSELALQQENVTAAEFELTGLKEGTEYYWHIKAVNEQYESDWSEAWAFKTKPPKVLSAPVLTEPLDAAINVAPTVTLKWNPVDNAVKYHLQVSDKLFFNTKLIDDTLNETQFVLNNLEKEKKYYWRVRINDGIDDGPWAKAYSFTVGTGNSIADNKPADQLLRIVSVRPNPVLDSRVSFVIESSVDRQGRISIVNTIGQIVYSSEMPLISGCNEYLFALPESLTAGVYSILLESGGNTVNSRMAIIR